MEKAPKFTAEVRGSEVNMWEGQKVTLTLASARTRPHFTAPVNGTTMTSWGLLSGMPLQCTRLCSALQSVDIIDIGQLYFSFLFFFFLSFPFSSIVFCPPRSVIGPGVTFHWCFSIDIKNSACYICAGINSIMVQYNKQSWISLIETVFNDHILSKLDISADTPKKNTHK